MNYPKKEEIPIKIRSTEKLLHENMVTKTQVTNIEFKKF